VSTAFAAGCSVARSEVAPLRRAHRCVRWSARGCCRVRTAVAALSPAGLPAAAHAITTTDAFPKTAVRRLSSGRPVTVAALARRRMIAPRCDPPRFVVTDARSLPAAQRTLRAAVDARSTRSRRRDTSTNDTVLLLQAAPPGTGRRHGSRDHVR